MKTLIICERPSASAKIAAAVAQGKPVKRELNGVPYYEFGRDGCKFIVVSALGHLFTLKNKRPMKDYPLYDIKWAPAYHGKRAKQTRAFIHLC